MKKSYQTVTVFCDCLECPYNDYTKDYTCMKKEIYLDQGDCKIAKEIQLKEKTRC